MRWQLEAVGGGTRLTLWTNIDRRFIAMGAAGWHLCFDVLDHLLNGTPLGRIVGPEAMKFAGWQRLHAERSEEHTSELQSQSNLVCRLLLEKKKKHHALKHLVIYNDKCHRR